jgi:hypothetical protein
MLEIGGAGLAEDDGRYGAEKPDGEQDRADPLLGVPPTAVALPVLGGMFGVPGEGALVDRHVDASCRPVRRRWIAIPFRFHPTRLRRMSSQYE